MPSVPTLPGINSTYSKVVEDLMKVERIPLDKKEKTIEATRTEKSDWQRINTQCIRLLDASKALYGFETPFNQKTGNSSNEGVVTVAPSRDASLQEFDLTVLNKAKGDSFRSAPLPLTYSVPKGQYGFTVGDKKFAFYFKGGSLKAFSDALNQKSKSLLKSSLIKIDKEHQIWLLESTREGREQRLGFEHDALPLLTQTRMIDDTPMLPSRSPLSASFTVKPGDRAVLSVEPRPNPKGTWVVEYHFPGVAPAAAQTARSGKAPEGTPGSAESAPPNSAAADGAPLPGAGGKTPAPEGTAADAAANRGTAAASESASLLTDPLIPSSGSVTVEDVTLFQAPSYADFSDTENKGDPTADADADADADTKATAAAGSGEGGGSEPAESANAGKAAAKTEAALPSTGQAGGSGSPTDTAGEGHELILKRLSGDQSVFLPPEGNSLQWDAETMPDLQQFIFQNPHSFPIVIDSVYLTDGTGRPYTPTNPLSLAQDAKIRYNDLIVTRPTNRIDDLIQGTTLTLNGESPEAVHASIVSDTEAIKNSLFEFVFHYNQLMQTINVMTSTDPKVVEELTFLDDEQREKLQKSLGVLKGDNTLNSLKNFIQRTASDLWPTSPNNPIDLLSKMGIGTHATQGFGGAFNPSKLRGYLEVNEKQLDETIAAHLDEMKHFFGYDSDGDFVLDKGMALELSRKLQGYTQTGGILFTKFQSYDSKIDSLQKETQIMEEKLKDKEIDYKIKFGRMESLMKEMDNNAKSLENLQNRSKE